MTYIAPFAPPRRDRAFELTRAGRTDGSHQHMCQTSVRKWHSSRESIPDCVQQFTYPMPGARVRRNFGNGGAACTSRGAGPVWHLGRAVDADSPRRGRLDVPPMGSLAFHQSDPVAISSAAAASAGVAIDWNDHQTPETLRRQRWRRQRWWWRWSFAAERIGLWRSLCGTRLSKLCKIYFVIAYHEC